MRCDDGWMDGPQIIVGNTFYNKKVDGEFPRNLPTSKCGT